MRKWMHLVSVVVRTVFVLITCGALSREAFSQSQLEGGSGFVEEVVLADLPPATSVSFASGNRIYLALKDGIVRVVQDGILLPDPFLDISTITNRRTDRGLGGIAVDPQFPTRPYIYLAHTYDPPGLPADDVTPRVSRIIRVTADAARNYNVAAQDSTVVLVGKQGTAANTAAEFATGTTIVPEPASCMTGLTMDGQPIEDCLPSDELSHSAGSLVFGSDGFLYASHGDGSSYSGATKTSLRSQMLDSLAGKIIRIDPATGFGVPGNPFYDSSKPNTNRSKVWAYGFRNPFRINLNQALGQVYIGDVGTSSWEELNIGKGGNFGWPCYEGGNTTGDTTGTGSTLSVVNSAFQMFSRTADFCGALYRQGLGAVVAPVFSYRHPVDSQGKDLGGSITGVAWYSGLSYPAKYQGTLFVADYAQRTIRYLTFDERGIPTVQPFAKEISDAAGPVQLIIGPDTNLYAVFLDLVTRKSELRRYRHTGSTNTPPIVKLRADPIGGPIPLSVVFDTSGTSDPDGQSLTYSWDFGDGTGSGETSAQPTHVYSKVGTYEVRVTVREQTAPFAESTAKVTVRTGVSPPRVHIDSPLSSTTYAIGDSIAFSGYAEFEGVRVPESALTWTILQEHNLHEHLVDELQGISSGSFEPGEHSDNTRYIVCLYATAGEGLDDQSCVTVNPRVVPITLLSDPVGATVTYIDEELEVLTPYVVYPVERSRQTIVAAPFHQARSFTKWSDGVTAQERSFVAGDSPASFTALYENLPPRAVISGPAFSGVAPFSVSLSALESSDPEGAGLQYRWTLPGGETSNGPLLSRTFTTAGSYVVTLRVTDSLGMYSETQRTISVFASSTTNASPVVIPPLPHTARLGEPLWFSGLVSDDGLPKGILETLWSRVRGPSTLAFSEPGSPSTGVSASASGTYLVKLEANDSASRAARNTVLTINPPSSSFGVTGFALVNATTDTVIPGYENIRNGAVIDPTTVETSSINVKANTRGDGIGSVVFLSDAASFSTDNVSPYSLAPSTTSNYPAFTPTKKRYLITAAPFSGSGGTGSAGDALSIQITFLTAPATNNAPTARIQSSVVGGSAPLTVAFDGSTSTDSDGDPVTFMWSLGGEETSTRAITSKTFTSPGSYSVSLTVTDPAGTKGTATTTIVVGDVPTPTPTTTPTMTPTATATSTPASTSTSTPTVTPTPVSVVNKAPVVNAGLPQNVSVGSTIRLNGVVTDDGLPSSQLRVLWSRVRGATTIAFSNPQQAITGVSAPSIGTYLLKLEADDTALRTAQNTLLTVNPSAPSFSVQSLTLINAATDLPLVGYENVSNGAIISLSALGTNPSINIRANTVGSGVGSVRWLVDAATASTDDTAPFAIAPSVAADYPTWPYSRKIYRVTAVPYSAVGGAGTQGGAFSLQFTLK